MITSTQKKLIETGVLALATCQTKTNLNVIAVACCKVVGKDKILITDNFMNKTRLNLLKNNHVALAVWSKDMESGYQFKGVVKYLSTGNYKDVVDNDPNNKGLAHKAAILVKVTEIWDLANPKLIYKK